MTDSKPRARQRALCVGVLLDADDNGDDDPLRELSELLRTAGVATVGKLTQRREHPHPRTYLGSGKLLQAREAAEAADANLVACDDELTPHQERNLERAVGLPVVDRTAVILDIFADHASTAEGKLQVELAQLEYNLARIRGLWSHLERLGGGIGTRGPGETQIETDRRLARDRIAVLRRRLDHVKSSRAVMRAERERAELPRVALVGYTNVGKSTLLNALTATFGEAAHGASRDGGTQGPASVGDRLFHTLDPTTRTVRIGGRKHLLTDTVGFIEKLPHELVDAFGATLEETVHADLLLHVVDASVPEERLQTMRRAVEQTLLQIGAGETPTRLVCNKGDLLTDEQREDLRLRHPQAIHISAHTGVGLPALAQAIEDELRAGLTAVDLLVPYTDGGRLAQLHELAGELHRRDTPEGVRVTALLPERLAASFARYAVA